MSQINYSIVIPILNESETIDELWKQLSSVMVKLDCCWEVIFVDDGSTDSSLFQLQQLSQHHPEIKVLSLSRNFGHQPALTAGIDNAKGEATILMDGDLQDAPGAIIDFIELWRQGYDVVYAIRRKRKEKWLKRKAFRCFYRIQSYLSEVKLPRDAGIFSLMDRKVVASLQQMPERNRYLSGLRAFAGFNQICIPVERGPRYHGEPRVKLSKLFKLAFDGIFSFSTVPL
ncbi:MAG: glycosyltransferase family 2 protein, partial [Pleurocapsa sp.]